MRKALKDKAEDIRSWMENYDKSTAGALFKAMASFLASVPGGEEFEDVGYKPIPGMGWKEYELITDLLHCVDSKRDVEDLAAFFFEQNDE